MKKREISWLSLVGLVVLLVALVSIIWFCLPPRGERHRVDVYLSLCIEVIGAFLTAYTVGRFVQLTEKQKEEQKLLPAKCILYAKMIQKIDRLLFRMLPPSSYMVGTEVYVSEHGAICIPKIEKESDSWRSEMMRTVQDRTSFDVSLLNQTAEWLDGVLNHSAALLEPGSIHDLMRLQQGLESLLDFFDKVDQEDPQFMEGFTGLRINTVWAAIEVRHWLQEMLGKHFRVADASYFAMS
jgi:hypothetical protein